MFTDAYVNTIGVDFKFREIQRNGQFVKLQIWDTAGSERFRSIVGSYFKNSQGCFLVYDITNMETFEHIQMWNEQLKQEAPECEVVLIGSKSDLNHQRAVSTSSAESFAKENKMRFLETSAKNGTNVEKMFEIVTDLMLKKYTFTQTDDDDGRVNMSNKPQVETKGNCC